MSKQTNFGGNSRSRLVEFNGSPMPDHSVHTHTHSTYQLQWHIKFWSQRIDHGSQFLIRTVPPKSHQCRVIIKSHARYIHYHLYRVIRAGFNLSEAGKIKLEYCSYKHFHFFHFEYKRRPLSQQQSIIKTRNYRILWDAIVRRIVISCLFGRATEDVNDILHIKYDRLHQPLLMLQHKQKITRFGCRFFVAQLAAFPLVYVVWTVTNEFCHKVWSEIFPEMTV